MVSPPRGPKTVFDALAERQLLVVSGKGGVGRTTVAALLGLALARRGRRVLVTTVGLDDRLAWMVGLPALTEAPVAAGRNLFVQRVVPQVCVREYGALILRSERLASAVFDSGPMRRVIRSVPGLDDFAVLGKIWHEAIRAHSFDAIVFDGPATGHLRYCLGIPNTILRTLHVGPLPREARLMQESLTDGSRVQAVLVGLPDRWPLTELGEMAASLREELHVNIGALVVNGLWPAGPSALAPPSPDRNRVVADDPDGAVARMFAAVSVVGGQAQRQREGVRAWLAGEAAAGHAMPRVLGLPWRWQGFTGARDLEEMLADVDREDAGEAEVA